MSDWQLIADILREMHDGGFDVFFGPHANGMLGYYACFFSADEVSWCDECEFPILTWGDAGHGETLIDAIEMGRAIALGLAVDIPSAESFIP